MDRQYESHILSVCTALGGFENGVYTAGDEAADCLRDLKRFLRLDDEAGEKLTLVLLGTWRFADSDLIPLLVQAAQDSVKLAIAVCEVLVPLTWPPENTTHIHREIMIVYKAAFVKKDTWAAIVKVMVHLLAVPFSDRPEKDHARLRLVLCLLRNVLAIDDAHDTISSSNKQYWNSTIHEDLLILMQKESMLDLLVSLISSCEEAEFKPWSLLLLEITALLFRERRVSDIITTPTENSGLALALAQEKAKKGKIVSSSRHSRFGSTYSIKVAVLIALKSRVEVKSMCILYQKILDYPWMRVKAP